MGMYILMICSMMEKHVVGVFCLSFMNVTVPK